MYALPRLLNRMREEIAPNVLMDEVSRRIFDSRAAGHDRSMRTVGIILNVGVRY